MRFRIRHGLDIPIDGQPAQEIAAGPGIPSVALLGSDYVGLKPKLLVGEGDRVKLGQPLFADRRRTDIRYTSPGAGVVTSVNRGARRALQSVVVRLEGDDAESLDAFPREALPALDRAQVTRHLVSSGLWTALRARPLGHVADPGSEPHSIFVTAMESDPLAARADVIIADEPQDFADGLSVLPALTSGPVYLCVRPDADIPRGDPERITVAEFLGPHPAGLPGTHIDRIDPVTAGKTVWHVDYQDVMAIGRLLTTGRLPTERIVAVGGPLVNHPRLVRTRLGASTDALVGPARAGRVISGSVLSGHTAEGPTGYLGRYHRQVCVLPEAHGVHRPRFSTALHGRPGAFAPVPAFERVMPLDVLPVPLLRALLVGDTETARALGCLGLIEEDLSLLTYVCPGKHDYGPLLRSALTSIEREG